MLKFTAFSLLLASSVAAVTFDTLDSAGYYLPSSGVASTTQFLIGPELSSGTACGAHALPSGSPSGSIGSASGPGYLYAAINQLAFGANPSAGAGGAGGACGICYKITPVSSAGVALTANALTFRIVDECPAAAALSGGSNCTPCNTSEKGALGQTWLFDIAVDAMSAAQYKQFYNGVTDGSNWYKVNFQHVSCVSGVNDAPSTLSWGCASGCSNNDAATVCADV